MMSDFLYRVGNVVEIAHGFLWEQMRLASTVEIVTVTLIPWFVCVINFLFVGTREEFVIFCCFFFVARKFDTFMESQLLLGKELSPSFRTTQGLDEGAFHEVVLPILNTIKAVTAFLVEVDAKIIYSLI